MSRTSSLRAGAYITDIYDMTYRGWGVGNTKISTEGDGRGSSSICIALHINSGDKFIVFVAILALFG